MRGTSSLCVWTTTNGKNVDATIHTRPTCRMLTQSVEITRRAHRQVTTLPLRPQACSYCARDHDPSRQTTHTNHGLANALHNADTATEALDAVKSDVATDGGSYRDMELTEFQEAGGDA